MKFLSRALLALGVVLIWAGSVGARAYLDRSFPADGEVLLRPPKEIKVWFTEAIQAKASTLKLLNADGRPVSGTAQFAVGQGSCCNTSRGAGSTASGMVLIVPPLPPGDYTVEYQVLSADSHTTKESFRFTVSGPESAQAPPVQPSAPQSQPAGSQPAGSQPAGSQPAASQPAASQPAASQPAASQPAASQPAESQPAESQPAESQPAASQVPFQPPARPAAEPVAMPAPRRADRTVHWGLWLGLATVSLAGGAFVASRRLHRGG